MMKEPSHPSKTVSLAAAHGYRVPRCSSYSGGQDEVVGIDVEIRQHNRLQIEKHPLADRITRIEGSSTDPEVAAQVRAIAEGKCPILVMLHSNHAHDHVFRDLELYSPLVTPGSYLIVFDTIIEHMPDDFFPDRPWGKGNNPLTAVHQFLKITDRFEIDHDIDNKLLITVCPDGYLRCARD